MTGNPYYTSEGKGCRLKNGKIIVTSENAQLKLVFEGEENAETYLVAEGVDYDGLSPREMISDKKWEKMTTYEQNKLLEEKMADGVTGKKVRKHPSSSEGVFSKNLSGSLRINIMRTAASIIFSVIPDIAKELSYDHPHL